ncbi:MAG TPA: hypothetical protein VHG30_11460, partial [Microvirga sp.]|nr:hypothetical protein [Microvirga sp.]
GSAPDRASAEVAFRDVLSGKPLDVPLPEGAQRTEAVVHFHKTGENLYNGKESARLPGEPQLTYCTNIHAGESFEAIAASLDPHVPSIKAAVAPDHPFGVGLRLSRIVRRPG